MQYGDGVKKSWTHITCVSFFFALGITELVLALPQNTLRLEFSHLSGIKYHSQPAYRESWAGWSAGVFWGSKSSQLLSAHIKTPGVFVFCASPVYLPGFIQSPQTYVTYSPLTLLKCSHFLHFFSINLPYNGWRLPGGRCWYKNPLKMSFFEKNTNHMGLDTLRPRTFLVRQTGLE